MITPHKPPQLSCPTCGRMTPISNAPHLPFCSDRCRLIDLGRWLDEQHSVPATSNDDEEHDDESKPMLGSSSENSEVDRRPIRLPPGWHDA